MYLARDVLVLRHARRGLELHTSTFMVPREVVHEHRGPPRHVMHDDAVKM